MFIAHLNPAGLPRNPAFSQAVVVPPGATTIHIGGQNAVHADGAIAGDDLASQVVATLANLQTVLAAADATLDDVVSWSILLVDGQPLPDAFGAFASVWGRREHPPAITVAFVAALADPRFLVEISAVAATLDHAPEHDSPPST